MDKTYKISPAVNMLIANCIPVGCKNFDGTYVYLRF